MSQISFLVCNIMFLILRLFDTKFFLHSNATKQFKIGLLLNKLQIANPCKPLQTMCSCNPVGIFLGVYVSGLKTVFFHPNDPKITLFYLWHNSNIYLLFRTARAERSQCRRCQALGSWGYGKLERAGRLGEGWGK